MAVISGSEEQPSAVFKLSTTTCFSKSVQFTLYGNVFASLHKTSHRAVKLYMITRLVKMQLTFPFHLVQFNLPCQIKNIFYFNHKQTCCSLSRSKWSVHTFTSYFYTINFLLLYTKTPTLSVYLKFIKEISVLINSARNIYIHIYIYTYIPATCCHN